MWNGYQLGHSHAWARGEHQDVYLCPYLNEFVIATRDAKALTVMFKARVLQREELRQKIKARISPNKTRLAPISPSTESQATPSSFYSSVQVLQSAYNLLPPLSKAAPLLSWWTSSRSLKEEKSQQQEPKQSQEQKMEPLQTNLEQSELVEEQTSVSQHSEISTGHPEEPKLTLEPQSIMIATYFSSLTPASQNPHSFLPPPSPKEKKLQKDTEKLLLHVVGGEQDEAEAMLKRDPVFALSYGTVTDKSERKFNRITGFQYAIWALDWHMWEMMLRQFTKNEHWKSAAEQYQELDTKSTEHGKVFNLEPLIQALQTYSDKYSEWPYEERKKHWCQEIGRLQRQLPRHVVSEYCRPDRSFKPCPSFTEQTPLPRGKGKEKEWYESGGYKLGTDLAWYRGFFSWGASICLTAH
jgi:hypothetical protein